MEQRARRFSKEGGGRRGVQCNPLRSWKSTQGVICQGHRNLTGLGFGGERKGFSTRVADVGRTVFSTVGWEGLWDASLVPGIRDTIRTMYVAE